MPKHCFLNRAEHRNRLVSYTSSESVSSSDSEGNGMPSLIGPLNEIKSRKRTETQLSISNIFQKHAGYPVKDITKKEIFVRAKCF